MMPGVGTGTFRGGTHICWLNELQMRLQKPGSLCMTIWRKDGLLIGLYSQEAYKVCLLVCLLIEVFIEVIVD